MVSGYLTSTGLLTVLGTLCVLTTPTTAISIPRLSDDGIGGLLHAKGRALWGFAADKRAATVYPKLPYSFFLQYQYYPFNTKNSDPEAFKRDLRICVDHTLRFDHCLKDEDFDVRLVRNPETLDSIIWLNGHDNLGRELGLKQKHRKQREPLSDQDALKITIKRDVIKKWWLDYFDGHVKIYIVPKIRFPIIKRFWWLWRIIAKRFGIANAQSPKLDYAKPKLVEVDGVVVDDKGVYISHKPSWMPEWMWPANTRRNATVTPGVVDDVHSDNSSDVPSASDDEP